MKPSVVLVTTDQEKNAQLTKLGVSFIEVRVDLFKKQDIPTVLKVLQQRQEIGIPLLLTVRNDVKEGAKKSMSPQQKLDLLEALLPFVDWVDIELSFKERDKAMAIAAQLKKKVVISVHDFKRTPHDLGRVWQKAKAKHAHAMKFAFNAADESDVLRLVEWTWQHRRENIITMCVGPWGPLSRLLLPEFGSRWVYTFLKQSTAPGQLNINDYQRLNSLLV